jgi:putative iron-regulated protein
MKFLPIFLLSVCFFLAGCSKESGSVDKKAFLKNYAAIVYANYEDSYTEVMKLKSAVDAFVATPDAAKLEACKKAWLAAREPYGQTEAFRFAGGPIDDEDGPEGALNAWPLDENYIDYVKGKENSGIVNDLVNYPKIDIATLESLNEKGGETNISIGYHAIEFLLWGQDDVDTKLKTPGQRPYTDYLTTGGTAANQSRRGQYLKAVCELLVKHLGSMKDEWDPKGKDNYQAKFLSMKPDEALKNVLTGIGTLSKSELSGERIFVALDNQDQEDEHSCFSDNTHRDIILNAQGIRNVYSGTYKRVDGSVVKGTSINDLVQKLNEKLAMEIDTMSAQTVKNTEAIPVPFDNALTSETVTGNGPIMKSVKLLQKQGDKFTEAATLLGVKIGTDLPE